MSSAGADPIGEGWDAELATWPRAHLLQSEGWGRVQAASGWDPLWRRVRVAGRPEALPVLVLRSRAAACLPTRLYVPRGPACAAGDAAAWDAVGADLDGLARSLKVASVSVEPAARSDEVAAITAVLGPRWGPSAALQPAHTAVVDLSGGEEAVLARMRPKTRYNARLAVRRGVEAGAVADQATAAEELARLCAATAARQGIAQPGAAHLHRVLACLPGSRVVIARVGGEAVAGVLVAWFGDEAIYLYGGSTERFRERQPSTLVHLAAIRLAIAAGCRRYDLWGLPPSADPAHPWHGLRQFKLGLGGVEEAMAGGLRIAHRPALDRLDTLLVAVRTRVRRARRALRPGMGHTVARAGVGPDRQVSPPPGQHRTP